MSGYSLELKNVNLTLGGNKLFSNLSLKIAAGESFVIVGPSGTGKSTILKIFSGLQEVDSGEVLIDGKNLMMLSETEQKNMFRHIGMLFQKNALFDSLSVEENIKFPLREVGGKTSHEIDEISGYFLGAVGISHSAKLFPHEISGGMQKRLGIARALALNPSVIFYDDPTAGLDPITSRKIIELILELRKSNNSTLVTVTNDMHRAYQLADKIGFCFNDEFIFAGSIEQTKTHANPSIQQFIKGEIKGPLSFVANH